MSVGRAKIADAVKDAAKTIGSTLQSNRRQLDQNVSTRYRSGQEPPQRFTNSNDPAKLARGQSSNLPFSDQLEGTDLNNIKLIEGPILEPDDGKLSMLELAKRAPEFREESWIDYPPEHQRLILRMAIRWQKDVCSYPFVNLAAI